MLDLTGNILVSEYANGRISVFSPTGAWIRKIGSSGIGHGQLLHPLGISVDSRGNTVVCDRGNARIQIFDKNDKPIKVITSGQGPQFSNLWGLALSSNDDIIVCDSSNHRLQLLSSEGQFLKNLGGVAGAADGQMLYPAEVALDKDGNIILLDYNNHQFQIWG